MNGCTHFKCDSCGKIKPIEEQEIIKCAQTLFNHRSNYELRYTPYHMQICKKCKEGE